jgi:hypothetical protein
MRIKPNPDQIKQLLRCAKIDGDKLADLAIYLHNLTNPPLVPDRLLQLIKEQVGNDDADILLSQLFSLSMLVRASESTSIEVMKAIRAALDAPQQQEELDAVAPALQSLIDSTPIRLVTKAMELSYDYTNLLRKARILTDIRPLFDEQGDAVEAAVVTHTLRLGYSSECGNHELSVALDLQDVKKLRDQCDRAIKKASSIRDEFVRSTSKPCLISGESEEHSG